MTIVAATGHRPNKLGGYGPKVRYALGGLAVEYLHEVRPEKVISGMALGWDQAIAAAAFALGIPFIAAVPLEGQEKRWPAASQARWRRLIERAAEVHIVTPGRLYGDAITTALYRRNLWMVERCDRVVALWDGTGGGTHNCIQHAEKAARPIDNLWSRWTLDDDTWGMVG